MSKYKWRDLLNLNSKEKAYESPLSCVAHIDVNAFFAQVEQVRCGYSREDPVVAVQWNSILAISYCARKYNISRMDGITEALKKCDKLIPVHTAVFRKGEDYWRYYDGCGMWNTDKKKQLSPSNFKVALEPYRRESRKLLKMFQQEYDLVEKASVDEAFIDLGRTVFRALLIDEEYDQFNDIRDRFRYGNYSVDDYLPPLPDLKNLQFSGDVFNPQNRPLFEDWDDVLMCFASISTQKIRELIDKQLGYTTSCGITMTKSLCKLASNYKKPSAQTIVKNSCINEFLDCGEFEINSFWTLGGLRGKEIMDLLHLPKEGTIEYIRDSWPTSSEDLMKFLSSQILSKAQEGADFSIGQADLPTLSEKLFKLVRGQLHTKIEPRPMPKSMMSKKNMRNNDCSTMVDCIEWLEVFCSELTYRVRDLEEEYEKVVLPRSAIVSIRGKAGMTYTQSTRLPSVSNTLTSRQLFINACKLVNILDKEYGKQPGVYPLASLSLTITNIDIIDKGKSVVDMFKLRTSSKTTSDEDQQATISPDVSGQDTEPRLPSPAEDGETPIFKCPQCDAVFSDAISLQEHTDFHLSVQLSEQLNGISQDSTTLSYAERILLFGKRPNRQQSSTSKPKRLQQKQKQDGGILKFFKK